MDEGSGPTWTPRGPASPENQPPRVRLPVEAHHNASQHNATQCNTSQRNATQHIATQHNTTQHNTTQHNTTQRNATQRNTTQRNTSQRNTTQRNLLLLPGLALQVHLFISFHGLLYKYYINCINDIVNS